MDPFYEDPTLEAYNRLLEEHCTPTEGSIAHLANLHALAAQDPVMIEGEKCYPMAIQILDEMMAAARAENDAGFFRRYTKAIEMAASGKQRNQSLPAEIVVDWMDFIEEHGRAPSREEVKVRLGLKRGEIRWRGVTPRHVCRAFQAVDGLFEHA
jgi:hypothetical protein